MDCHKSHEMVFKGLNSIQLLEGPVDALETIENNWHYIGVIDFSFDVNMTHV